MKQQVVLEENRKMSTLKQLLLFNQISVFYLNEKLHIREKFRINGEKVKINYYKKESPRMWTMVE